MLRVNLCFFIYILLLVFIGNISSSDKAYLDEFISSQSLISGRVAALGSAGIASVNDAFAVLYNPSLMLDLKVHTIGLEKSTLLFETDMHSFSYVYPFENYSLGITYVSMQPQKKYFIRRDEEGIDYGTFNVSDDAYIIAYAKKINFFNRNYYFGTNLKYIDKTVGSYGGSNFDLGLYTYNKISNKFAWACGIDNVLGSSIGDDNMPRKLRAGLYYKYYDFLFSAQTDLAAGNNVFMGGIEYNYNDFFFVRAGLEDFRFSAGLGINYSDFEFNYVFKNISADGINDNLNMFSFGWKIGLNKTIRLEKFEEYFSLAREFLILEDYGNAIRNMELAADQLNPKADAEQYRTVMSLKDNTKTIYESKKNAAEAEKERNVELFAKGKILFEENKFDLARFEFMNISPAFPEYAKVEEYIEKCDEGSRKQRQEEEQQRQLVTLWEEYNSAKDIQNKIGIGEMLLRIKFNENLEEEIEKMKVTLREQGIVYDPARINQELVRLQEETTRQRVQDSLNRIRNFMNQGYYELANNELMETRRFLNNPNWQEALKNEIDLAIIKAEEEKVLQETINSLYMSALTDLNIGRDNRALNSLVRLLGLAPNHTEALTLKSEIETELRKTGQRVISSEVVVSESERRLRQATIERLYQEGLSFYIAGNITEARARWEEILEMDPENEKVKQYLRVIR